MEFTLNSKTVRRMSWNDFVRELQDHQVLQLVESQDEDTVITWERSIDLPCLWISPDECEVLVWGTGLWVRLARSRRLGVDYKHMVEVHMDQDLEHLLQRDAGFGEILHGLTEDELTTFWTQAALGVLHPRLFEVARIACAKDMDSTVHANMWSVTVEGVKDDSHGRKYITYEDVEIMMLGDAPNSWAASSISPSDLHKVRQIVCVRLEPNHQSFEFWDGPEARARLWAALKPFADKGIQAEFKAKENEAV